MYGVGPINQSGRVIYCRSRTAESRKDQSARVPSSAESKRRKRSLRLFENRCFREIKIRWRLWLALAGLECVLFIYRGVCLTVTAQLFCISHQFLGGCLRFAVPADRYRWIVWVRKQNSNAVFTGLATQSANRQETYIKRYEASASGNTMLHPRSSKIYTVEGTHYQHKPESSYSGSRHKGRT